CTRKWASSPSCARSASPGKTTTASQPPLLSGPRLPMLETTPALVAVALRDLGLGPGQNVLVHSAVQFLGRPMGGVGMYYATLSEALAGGTVAVPTFTFAFARGEPYDPQVSPSEGMGAFSEWVR